MGADDVEAAVARMSAILGEAFPAEAPGAALTVRRKGAAVLEAGYGLANLELGVPVTPDMRFRIGSVTKQFTAAAVLLLADDGRLRIEDTLSRHLPEHPRAGDITVEHLLTHTSGVPNYTSLPSWVPLWRQDLTMDELIGLFKDEPLEFEPGERWSYSNSGYILLTALIERVSGQSYAEFLRSRIFKPLGMSRTTYDDTLAVIPGRVPGYSREDGEWRNATYLSMTHPLGAGGLLSSVGDLARWDDALRSGAVLSAGRLDRAWTDYRLNGGDPAGYGHGWAVGSHRGHRVISHGGGIHGFTCYALTLPDDGIYVALLTNSGTGDPPPGYIATRIALLMAGEADEEPVEVELDEVTIEALAGVYRVEDADAAFKVALEEDHLRVELPDGGEQAYLPLSATSFFQRHGFDRLRFDPDREQLRLERPNGQVTVATRVPEPAA